MLDLLILGDPIIPLNAKERIVSRFKSGIKREASYFLRGKRVGVRRWWNDGALGYEWATDGDHHHGRWVRFHSNGVPDLEGSYRNGKRHGIRVQFDLQGRPIGTSEFRNGDGVDLWFLLNPGPAGLGEEWWYKNDLIHGLERCWVGRHLYRENSWSKGYPHGILREWKAKASLRPGLPEFWINGTRVTGTNYLKASKYDPTLPPYFPRDNRASRRFPIELVRTSRKRVLRIRERIKSLPLIGEFGVAAPKEQVINTLRSLRPFSNLTDGRPTKIQDHIYGRFEQATPSCVCIDWIDERWRTERLSRVTFHLEPSNAEGTRSILEFSHVGLGLSSRHDTKRFWQVEVFQELFGRLPVTSAIREVPHVMSFRNERITC